jgi:putative FmdB family regulatory protein
MPTYEYLCNKCEHAFEVVQSFTDPAIEQCPKCQGGVRKVYNNVGVVLRVVDFIKLIQDLPRLVKLRVSQKPKLKLNLRIKQVNLTKSGAEAFQL